ncbi:MAG: FimV/HubP family polar landmark protein, partial [Pseudomonas sp.]|nr:FimV/HubP family polar landmark protein [Pseudomonas sp.]
SAAPRIAAPPAAITEQARPAPLPAAQQGNTYRVVSGDILWKIAEQLTVDTGLSAQALMNDIFALNPQAFINGDINRLRVGTQLLLPDNIISVPPTPAEPAVTAGFLQVVDDSEAAPAPRVDLSAEEAVEEQARVEQELASQIAETSQLQQSLAQLSLQVQQLQEQMSSRDQQIAALQVELAARRASAEVTAAPAPVAVSPAVEVESGRNWLAIIAGLLVVLIAGVAGLFWRGRKSPEPALVSAMPVRSASMPNEPNIAPAESAAAAALGAGDASGAGPVWPAAGEDALQSANVYIAFGRLTEAANTLEKAWEAQPQRSDIGFRLLEVLALLGDAQGFNAHEAEVRESGFDPVRIDELKARHAELFSAPSVNSFVDMVLELDEPEAAPVEQAANDVQLNLDEMSLDADWDLVSPFAPAAKRKGPDIFELSDGCDARSPFAETMLVEETSSEGWDGDELNIAFLDDFDQLDGSDENLSKLNVALTYIEQGSLDSACQILNEVINEGDEEQKQEARQLLAKIA